MHELLHSLSIWSVIVPAITGLILFKYLDRESKIIWLITVLACVPQIGVSYLDISAECKNIFYNVYTLAEVTLYALLFYRRMQSVFFKRLQLVTLALYLVFLGFFYPVRPESRFYNEWVSVAGLVYLIWVLLYLFEEYTGNQYQNMLSVKSPFFWYCVALLVYASTTFLIFTFYYKISPNHRASFKYLWNIHDIFNSIMYILFTAGIITSYRRRPGKRHLYE